MTKDILTPEEKRAYLNNSLLRRNKGPHSTRDTFEEIDLTQALRGAYTKGRSDLLKELREYLTQLEKAKAGDYF